MATGQDERSTTHGRPAGIASMAASIGLAFAALIVTMGVLRVGGESLSRAVFNYGDAFVEGVATLIVVYSASRLDDELSRGTWFSVGAAIALTAVGDVLWVQGEAAHSGVTLAELTYLTGSIVMAIALIRYALSYRARVDVRRAIAESSLIALAAGLVLWAAFLNPAVEVVGGITPAVLQEVAYVVVDFALLLAPAIVVLLVVVASGNGRDARPWLFVVVGAAATVVSDAGWFLERIQGGTVPGPLTTFGFMASTVFIAAGALNALILQEERARTGEA